MARTRHHRLALARWFGVPLIGVLLALSLMAGAALGWLFALLAISVSVLLAARLLVASERHMRAVLDHALDAVIGMDEHGRIIGWNLQAERMFGWSRDEVIGRLLAELIVPERLRQAHEHGWRRLVAGGEPRLLGRRFETLALTRDASEFPVELAVTPIHEGGKRYFSAFISDITERKRAEAEAERQRQRFRTLFMDAPSLMALTHGPEHTFELANAPVRALLGGREIIGHAVREALPDLVKQGVVAVLDRVYARGKPFVGKELALPLDRAGTPQIFYLDFVCQRTPSGDGVMIHAADVTEKVEARLRIEEAVRVRDEFLSNASHELKTPLTSLGLQMQSVSRIARQGTLDRSPERLTHLLEVSSRQVRRLTSLVQDLLDVSHLREHGLHLQLEEVDLRELVTEIAARLADELHHAGCTVEIVAPGPILGQWDKVRLEQVVTNLISNAIKYGAGEPIALALSSTPAAARLVVRDRGIGIPPEVQAKIFARFERAVSARNFGGLGLGLYLVRQILDAHGGTIGVESTLGEGATFTIELPRNS